MYFLYAKYCVKCYLHILSHFILNASLGDLYYYYCHLTDKGFEAQINSVTVFNEHGSHSKRGCSFFRAWIRNFSALLPAQH